MYVSGSLYDFERRFHHLAFTTGDIALFKLEAANYTQVTGNQRIKWEKEYRNRVRNWTGSLFIGGGGEPVETFYYLASDGVSRYKLPNGTDFYIQPS
jgi:hypothetical protein